MTDRRISQFTTEAQRRIADAVRRIERSALRETGQWADVPDPFNRVLRWGRTTTNYDYPTYPSSGGTYVVEMGEYQPDTLVPGDTPSKTFTPYDPAWTEVAVDPTGATIAQGTVVRVELHDGQWWIRPSASAGTVDPDTIVLSGPFFKSSSNAAEIYSTETGHEFYQSITGDASGIGLNILCDATSVYNDPIAQLTADGTYIITHVCRALTNIDGTLDTATVTSGGASAGTAHTHQVTYAIPHAMWANVYHQRRTGSVGAWSAVGSYVTTSRLKMLSWPDEVTGHCYVHTTSLLAANSGEQIGAIKWQPYETNSALASWIDSPSGYLVIRRVAASKLSTSAL